MISAREIAAVIEDFAPLYNQEDWDNSGFSIGNMNAKVDGVLIGLDCSMDLLEEAVSLGVNMVITHHPLIFNGIKKILHNDFTGSIIEYAIKNDIIIYSSHTAIDKVINGVSGQMADALGLINREILDIEGSNDNIGLGVVGDLPKSAGPMEFIERVKNIFDLEIIKSSKVPNVSVERVALCGGSGHSLINKAKESGAQAYISGDITYHYFLPDPDFMILDIGHYESEIGILKTIFTLVRKNFPNFATYITKSNKNLVYYY
ncbi:MAG: Nif3-like dinuclear metal center hexameric protein [Bacteroidales bacterium]